MSFVFNFKTRELSPMIQLPEDKVREYLPEDAMIVTDEQAKLLADSPRDRRDEVIFGILSRAMASSGGSGLGFGAKRFFSEHAELSMKANREDASVKLPEAEEGVFDTPVKVNVGLGDLLTKTKVKKLNHPSLLKYARDVLELDVADNEPYDILLAKVMDKQFGE